MESKTNIAVTAACKWQEEVSPQTINQTPSPSRSEVPGRRADVTQSMLHIFALQMWTGDFHLSVKRQKRD